MASNSPPAIVFVRHGETDWNKQGLVQGSVDTELNQTGRQQAQAVAKLLTMRRNEWAGFDIIVSPQWRARQTADYILQALDRTDFAVDLRVRELGFGIWEGRPIWEMKASPIYPPDAEGKYYWRPEGGESYEDGVARVDEWLNSLKKSTLVIAHGAVGRCLMGAVTHMEPHEIVNLPTPQGAYCDLSQGKIHWFDATGEHA